MTGLEVLALVLALFLLYELGALALRGTIGARTGFFRWLVMTAATITLFVVGMMIVAGK